jgi:diketogulonate reductase-like aldo/keto reductase
MEYKFLGNTREKLPVIGLGTWQYTGGSLPLRMGVALGANLIDTAERYLTEDAVAAAIRNIRAEVFVATKVRHENLRYADVLRACDNSLKTLGIDQIDLYQIHRPNPEVPIAETMRALDELVAAGKVRYIGVSNFSVAQMEAAQALTKNRIVSNQVRYSLADRTIEGELLPYCQKHDITVIAFSPLARGNDKLRSALRDDTLTRVAQMEGRTEIQVALNWCIAKPNVIAIPRASTVEHVGDVCAGAGWRLSPESMELLETAYKAAA